MVRNIVYFILIVVTLSPVAWANKTELEPIMVDMTNGEFYHSSFTRGRGFIVRPELYSGLFATFGYQINPYVQLSGGIGFGLDQYGGTSTSLGIRTYTSDTKFAVMFDYHIGLVNFQGLGLIRHTIIGGFSFKDFDLGAGLMYVTDGYDSGKGLSMTLGYNIRCYKHR